MVTDLLLFIPLAVLTNTVFPLPFDPVLLWFGGGHTFAEACVFAAFGSGCAGLAALADVTIIGALGRRWSHRQGPAVPTPQAGRGFYAAAFLVALLPIPYTTIRLALLTVRPRPLLYALIVSGARLPRYLVMLRLWQTLALPGWAGGALVLSAIGWMAWRGLDGPEMIVGSRSLHESVLCQPCRAHFDSSRHAALDPGSSASSRVRYALPRSHPRGLGAGLHPEGLRPRARALSASNRTTAPSPPTVGVALRVPGRHLIPPVPLDRSAGTERRSHRAHVSALRRP